MVSIKTKMKKKYAEPAQNSSLSESILDVFSFKLKLKIKITTLFYRNFILYVICIFSHILCMYVLSASTNHILNSSHVYVFKKIMNIILPCKVQIFWEGLKNVKKISQAVLRLQFQKLVRDSFKILWPSHNISTLHTSFWNVENHFYRHNG